MNFDGSDHQFVVALDKRTGKTVWRKERSIDFKDLDADGKPQTEGDLRKAFATPQVASIDGRAVLISQGAKATYAYEPLTGEELWRVEERTSHSGGTRPLVGFGMIFVPTGWSQGQILAIKPGKSGEVIDANAESAGGANGQLQIAWKTKRNAPKKPSLLLVDDLLFGIDDGGVAACLEAKTGAEVWRERVGAITRRRLCARKGAFISSAKKARRRWSRPGASSRCSRKTNWRMVSCLHPPLRARPFSCGREQISIASRIDDRNRAACRVGQPQTGTECGSRRFAWRLYSQLPLEIQRLAVKNYRLWVADHWHPSLRLLVAAQRGFEPRRSGPIPL